jgi:hypothetical protein
MFLISRPPPPKRAPQAMSIQSIHTGSESSVSVSRTHVLVQNSGHPPAPANQNQEHAHAHHSSPARRQYIRPALALRIDCPPATPKPKHWDLASRVSNLDVREEDGYVLSANGEGSTSGVFVPCEPLSAVRRAARPRRLLHIKPMALHRRRVSGITTSPISPTAVSTYFSFSFSLITNIHSHYLPTYPSLFLNSIDQFPLQQHSSSGILIRDCLPPTPLTPNTDFKNLYNNLRKCDVLPAAKTASSPGVPVPPAFPISPPVSPSASGSPSSPRQQRPVLHVQTSSPVGTSAPPPTPALTSPSPSTFQFRPSGRLPKRPPIPVWPTVCYPRAVVA